MKNDLFLKFIFGKDAKNAHVTDFIEDPLNIPNARRFFCWMGDKNKNYKFKNNTNQFFTISTFEDEEGRARRKRNLFLKTHVIVLDDVNDKIHIDTAKRLPKPTYILETSPGNEQWGYVLKTPCEDRSRVENLLDGLVANGLTQTGKDPGMKGVTRYVRLPESWNTKKNKNNGEPFKCNLKSFSMFRKFTLEQLAGPFGVNLDEQRYDDSAESASEIPDHPILSTVINIKAKLSPGRFDITCPWVMDHTDQSDTGTAVFTNGDASIGFKCHHGHCEERTQLDLLEYIELEDPGFIERYENFVTSYVFKSVIKKKPELGGKPDPLQQILETIQREEFNGAEARRLAGEYLKLVDKKPKIDQNYYHHELCDTMGWTKTEMTNIVKDLRKSWYNKESSPSDFYADMVYIREQNILFNTRTRIFFSPESFQNSYADIDPDARKNALTRGYVKKVDRLDFLPGGPMVFEEDGIVFGNSWINRGLPEGEEGDCSPWLDHIDAMGWGEYKKHLLQWMAFTILHPERKINHIILLGGLEGIGKDFILKPLVMAMGHYTKTIPGSYLTESHNDYMLRTKYLHINETELGDHKKASEVSANIKPLAAAPPDTIPVNPKHLSAIHIRNVVNVSMTTNSRTPLKISGPSRRLFPIWSDLNVRNEEGDMLPEWLEYFDSIWRWMDADGWKYCVHYLRNNVDLSDFSPGQAPPVTEFLKDITNDNKHPAEQTIEAFIKNEIGCFKSDIITAEDACDTLKAGLLTADNLMYIEPNYFTPIRFGRIASAMTMCTKTRARSGSVDIRPWIIRNHSTYSGMTATELYREYQKQIRTCR
jgi:hypothetical protein